MLDNLRFWLITKLAGDKKLVVVNGRFMVRQNGDKALLLKNDQIGRIANSVFVSENTPQEEMSKYLDWLKKNRNIDLSNEPMFIGSITPNE